MIAAGQNADETILVQDEERNSLATDEPLKSSSSEESPMRVRDMINLYNFATEKNQELARAKSVYLSANKAAKQDQTLLKDSGEHVGSKWRINQSPCSFRLSTTDGRTSMSRITDAALDGNGDNEGEKYYHSKTTIRKTSKGVRIVIDIFFDKHTKFDITESRVETDIPESRILTEFHQYTLARESKLTNFNV